MEQKALFNIKTIIATPWQEVLPHLDFVRTLREDILDYGTLSDYTLRRIANMETVNDAKGTGKRKRLKKFASQAGDGRRLFAKRKGTAEKPY